MTRRTDLLIYGAGGHGKVVLDAAQSAGWKVVGLLDDDTSLHGLRVLGVEILGGIEVVEETPQESVIVAIGNAEDRAAVAARVEERGARFATVLHPSAHIAGDVEIGEGAMVLPMAVVHTGARIGRHAIVNTGAIVEHECVVGDFAHISPGAQLGGGAVVERAAHVGLGASVAPGVHIGEGAIVGVGSAAVRNVEAGAIVGGVPAKPLPGRGT